MLTTNYDGGKHMIQDIILASVLCVGVNALSGYVKSLCRGIQLRNK